VQRPAAKPCSSSNSTFSLSWNSSHWSTTTRRGHPPSLSSLTILFLRRYQRKIPLQTPVLLRIARGEYRDAPRASDSKAMGNRTSCLCDRHEICTAGNVTVVVSTDRHSPGHATWISHHSWQLDALPLTDVILIYSTISSIFLLGV
jgi:hypothetical protein